MTAHRPSAEPRRRPIRPCPICAKPSDGAAYPFCSKRCADIDLARWLNGSYAIAVVEEDGAEPDLVRPDEEAEAGRG